MDQAEWKLLKEIADLEAAYEAGGHRGKEGIISIFETLVEDTAKFPKLVTSIIYSALVSGSEDNPLKMIEEQGLPVPHRDMRPFSQFLPESLRHLNAASYHNNVNVLRRPVQKYIAYISSYGITFQSQFIRRAGNKAKNLAAEVFFQFHIVHKSKITRCKINKKPSGTKAEAAKKRHDSAQAAADRLQNATFPLQIENVSLKNSKIFP